MEQQEEVVSVLREMLQLQREMAAGQREMVTYLKERTEYAQRATEESLRLQKLAVERARSVGRVVLAVVAVGILYIVYLSTRYHLL
jgi:t-SNARE complex subunit (syntaxin)